jgi:Fe-S-cluster containining protein
VPVCGWLELKEDFLRQQRYFDGRTGRRLAEYEGRGGRIFCGRGCRACCTLTVDCGFGEALLVVEALSDAQGPALDAYVARLRQLLPTVADFKSYLRMQRRELGDCPFLDREGACAVYEARPFACRALFSTRPADWCGVDFGELPAIEKQLFMAGLDRAVVDFPTHYLAEPRESARELEGAGLLAMERAFGFSLAGNLPYLVWLEKHYALSQRCAEGFAAVTAFLEAEGLNLPFVLHLDKAPA